MAEKPHTLKLNDKEAQYLRLVVQNPVIEDDVATREKLIVRLNILLDPDRQDQLEKEYRQYYWLHEEYLLSCPDNRDEIEEVECKMETICDWLGYTPAG